MATRLSNPLAPPFSMEASTTIGAAARHDPITSAANMHGRDPTTIASGVVECTTPSNQGVDGRRVPKGSNTKQG